MSSSLFIRLSLSPPVQSANIYYSFWKEQSVKVLRSLKIHSFSGRDLWLEKLFHCCLHVFFVGLVAMSSENCSPDEQIVYSLPSACAVSQTCCGPLSMICLCWLFCLAFAFWNDCKAMGVIWWKSCLGRPAQNEVQDSLQLSLFGHRQNPFMSCLALSSIWEVA